MPTRPATQYFYWRIFYSDGSIFSQFDEDGSENLFYKAVLKYPEKFEKSAALHEKRRLITFEFRDDITMAGWFKVTPELAANNLDIEVPKYVGSDELICHYKTGEKPFLMKTVKWNYNLDPEPHIDMYRIGRDGKTEFFLNKYGMVKQWEGSK